MKREVHAECHHEKGSEGSRKGEIYACRHAKFRHTPSANFRSRKDKRYFHPLKYNRVTHDEVQAAR